MRLFLFALLASASPCPQEGALLGNRLRRHVKGICDRMADYFRINIRPNFGQDKLPCDGRVGDLLVLTPLNDGDFDETQVGKASVWICTKAAWEPESMPAVWQRVQFDGFATCEFPVQLPPQDLPNLARG